MDEYKDIGKTFKKGLSEFQKSPDAKVWDKIVAELDKKEEKKKPLVIWWKLGGIAAAILLLVGIGYKIITNKNRLNNQQIITKSKPLDGFKSNIITKTDATNLVDTLQVDKILNFENVLVKNKIKEEKLEIKNRIKKKSKGFQKKTIQLNELIVTNKKENVIILSESITNNSKIISNNTLDTKKKISSVIIDKKEVIKLKEIEITKNKEVLKNKENENELIAIEDEFDVINKEEKQNKKWEVSIKGAPVFYSSLSKGSSLGNDLDSNSTSGDVTYSFGISVSYPISKKMKIRTGINNVDLAYKTEQVSTVSVLNAQSLSNNGLESFFVNDVAELGLGILDENIDLTQEINYFEIPLEIKYTILDKKLNIETITGFSTLLLNNNSITINNETNIGSVNNLKKISFTGNLGLGFNYKLSKKLHFNLEPSMKIQFNTYKDNVDYKPYFLGVYSGFSYQF